MKTVAEAGKELGISVYTLKHWIREGKIKAVKIGNRWKMEEEEIAKLKQGKF